MERILVLGLSRDKGGIENYILNLYEQIDSNTLMFDFLCKEDLSNEVVKLIKNRGGKIYTVGTFKKNIFGVWNKLQQIYNNNKYKKIYVNLSYAPTLIYILPSLNNGINKLYIHSHASKDIRLIRHLLFRYLFFEVILKNVNCVYMGCSKDACTWMYGKKISGSKTMHIINNGIKFERFKFSNSKRQEIRLKYNIKHDEFVVGHVGRFSAEKNHKFLVDTFYKFTKSNKKAKLLLVGEGSLLNNVKQQVESLKIADKVIFAGSTNDTGPFYNAMDCFWLPSIYEGLPIVAVEAETNGLPCVFSANIDKHVDIFKYNYFASIKNSEEWINKTRELETFGRNNVTKNELTNVGYELSNESNKVIALLLEQ